MISGTIQVWGVTRSWITQFFALIPQISQVSFPLEPLLQLGVLGTVLTTIVVVWWIYGSTLRSKLEQRFLAGLPWGTTIVISLLLAVYLFIQGGLQHWYDPVTLPFHSWSYFYPVGMIIAPFAHQGPDHLLGNLSATLLLAPIAEYAWGHFPENHSTDSRSTVWWYRPRIRAGFIFPAGTMGVGFLTSLLGWGPLIGFSGVVYAFAGFALVYYPFTTVIAVTADTAIRTVYRAAREPVVVREAHPAFIEPWWAEIAVQGHALGLFLGLLIGISLLARRRRMEQPSSLRLFVAGFLLAMSLSLWDIWWYRGGVTYVLYRGAGVIGVTVLAAVITASTYTQKLPHSIGTNVHPHRIALAILLIPVLVMGTVAVPLNTTTVDSPGITSQTSEKTINIRGYTVTYTEDILNQKVAIINVSIAGETTQVPTSGVIVVNDQRELWTTAIAKKRLAFTGQADVTVGGVGWRDTIAVRRRGWTVTDGGTAYLVWLHHNGHWQRVFESNAATAGPVLAGKTISLLPRGNQFYLRVTRHNRTLGMASLPRSNHTTVIAGITFNRTGNEINAHVNRTHMTIATKETYRCLPEQQPTTC